MARKIRMNCFGQDVQLVPETGFLPVIPYQFKTINNVAYCRFNNKNKTAIQRMEKVGTNNVVTQTWTYGNWTNCESLTYHPINKILEVEV